MSDIDTEVEEGGPTTWPRQDHEDRLKRCEAELAAEVALAACQGTYCRRWRMRRDTSFPEARGTPYAAVRGLSSSEPDRL